jgi:hypothetical protein
MGAAWARHAMCELTVRHGRGTAWARYGHGMGTDTAWARHAMCEPAFNPTITVFQYKAQYSAVWDPRCCTVVLRTQNCTELYKTVQDWFSEQPVTVNSKYQM